MRLILNILWFVFGGWISFLAWLLAGCLLAITIVGLPWTAAALRLARSSCAPFGRQVLPKGVADGGPRSGVLDAILNVIWFLLAGWWLALHHVVLALGLFVTIIGIPFGLQHLKLAVISLAPVGTSVVEG